MSTEHSSKTGFKFPKHHKLTGKKSIDDLFSNGSVVKLYPFLAKFIIVPKEESQHHKLLVSVPKRKFKRAVDRNLIRRRIKEAYRLNRHLLEEIPEDKKSLHIAYIYIGNKILSFEMIETKLIESLHRLVTKLKAEEP